MAEEKGQVAFRRLGQDATGSGLSDVSTKHDHYLYGKKEMKVDYTIDDIKVTVGSVHISCPCDKENTFKDVTEKDVLICCNCQAKYRVICTGLRVIVRPHVKMRS